MKKLLFVINVDWFFVSHFLPVAQKALQKGYEVHLACAFTDKEQELQALGIQTYSLDISRSGITLSKELYVIKQIYQILKEVDPMVVEFFTIKPILYGGIVSHFTKVERKVFYITGLGYIFIKKGLKGIVIKTIVKALYRLALFGKSVKVITENSYDARLVKSLGVEEKNIYIIKGAGVDLHQYPYVEETITEPLQIVMASRLLKDKGVSEFVSAAKEILEGGYNVKFLLYGDIDTNNPASLTLQEVEAIKKEGCVTIAGFCDDITMAFQQAHIIVLPSYREGFPKVLIEAAACGRAVVTTDVPGCRDAIIPNETGLLCKVKDVHSLATNIKTLLENSLMRHSMAKKGRILAEKEYDINKVLQEHFKVYGDLG